MATMPQRSKECDSTPSTSTLDVTIDALNLAKDISSIGPVQAAFGSVSVLLATIRVRSLPLCSNELLEHAHAGFHDQRTGIH